MTSFLQTYLPIIIYFLLIVLLIVFIILGIRLIQSINKIDRVVEDVNDKVQSLNGFFSVIDFITDKASSVTEKVADGFASLINKIFKKNEKEEIEDEDE